MCECVVFLSFRPDASPLKKRGDNENRTIPFDGGSISGRQAARRAASHFSAGSLRVAACNLISIRDIESRVFGSRADLMTIRPGISHGEWLLNPDEEVHGSAAYGLSQ